MQNFLYLDNTSENSDMNDSISILAYISQIRSNFLLQYELEALCLELYNSFKTSESTKIVETILTLLVNMEKQNFIILNNFRIYFNDKWFFKLVALSSLRQAKEVFHKKYTTVTLQEKYQIVREAMLTFQPTKMESIVMLRLINNVIKKNKYIITSDLALELLLFSQKVAVSPIDGYKSYAYDISRIALHALHFKGIKIFLDLPLLPIRGIETLELIPYFKQACNDKEFVSKLVTKVIQMFSNNIENREGGFLHKSILFEDFSYWQELVWPQFFVKLQVIDFRGEFFQSLLKYWLPQCVATYKLEFYTFTCALPIPTYLKGCILFETRHQGLIEQYDEGMIRLLNSLFADDDMSNLALKIVSSYFRKSLYPCDAELNLVNIYLHGRVGTLGSEELKYLHRFLSQIGVVGSELHNMEGRSAKEENIFDCYTKYARNLFMFYLKSLKTARKNIAAQILLLFWKLINGNQYLLNYKFDTGYLVFYKIILEDYLLYTKLIEEALLESNGRIPELTMLGQVVCSQIKLYLADYLLKFIDECTELNSIMAAESVQHVSSIIVFQNKPSENILLLNLFEATAQHFQTFSASLKGIFKGVLLFEAILEVSKNVHAKEEFIFVGLDTYCLPVILDILQDDMVGRIYQQEIETDDLDTAEQQYNLLCKIQKIVESLLNNILQYIIQDRNICLNLDKPKTIDLLVKIIETSNMRRPTTLSADALKHIAKLINVESQDDKAVHYEIVQKRNEDASYKINLLHNTLQKLCDVASVQSLTIRRNPESRLIIHALCQSDTHPQKPILTHTLGYLLGILSNPNSSDSTVSSAMHCTEILIADNTLYNHTLGFVPDVILQCVEHFKNRNWIVRNANIQLARSLVDRFLGVVIGRNNRAKSVEDLFCLFPHLPTRFCQILVQQPLTDSAIIVMQIFSESQIRRQFVETEYLEIARDIFLRLFTVVMKENYEHYGIFAVRAYTSLCLGEQIPAIIEDVVNFIVTQITDIKEKHTIRNFILLLHELYDKYLGYTEGNPVKPYEYYVIGASFNKLSIFLRRFNIQLFDLLLLKVLSIDEVVEMFKAVNFDSSDYTQRLWQHNYIPFLFINTEANLLDQLLKEILFNDVLDCIQVKVLSILVDRYSKNHFSTDIVQKFANILVQRMLVIDDSRQYLLLCYFKVIFLFYKCNKKLEIGQYCVEEMRSCYGKVKNIYKMSLFILVLAQVTNKNDFDIKFTKTVVKRFQNENLQNLETAEIISEMLPYLYVNVCCNCDRYRVFKMAVFFVMEHGLCDFAGFITKSKISSPLIAMIKILDFEVLIKSFDGIEVACKLVKEFYESVLMEYTTRCKITSKTYYVEEKHIFVDRLFIDKIVLKFINDFHRKYRNWETLRYHDSMQSDNKK